MKIVNKRLYQAPGKKDVVITGVISSVVGVIFLIPGMYLLIKTTYVVVIHGVLADAMRLFLIFPILGIEIACLFLAYTLLSVKANRLSIPTPLLVSASCGLIALSVFIAAFNAHCNVELPIRQVFSIGYTLGLGLVGLLAAYKRRHHTFNNGSQQDASQAPRR